MIELIGFLFACIGFSLSIIGSWFVSSKTISERRRGFVFWMGSNPFNIVVLLGVMLNIWSGLPLIFSLMTQFYFLYTAFRGWKANSNIL